MPLKQAIATSLVCVGLFAIPGTITHAALGHIDWRFAFFLTLGVIPGARIGSRLTAAVERPPAPQHGRDLPRVRRGHLRRRRDRRPLLRSTSPLGASRTPSSALRCSFSEPTRRARVKTASSISRVSLPVNVFCWLGWNEQRSVRPSASPTSTPWPNFGRGRTAEARDTAPGRRTRRGRRTPARRRAARAPAEVRPHASRSSSVGLLAGGAQRTAAVMYASTSRSRRRRARRRRLVREARAVHGAEQPVTRAVAGEHPTRAVPAVRGGRQADDHDTRARVAEAGTGLPQYSSSRNAARFSAPTSSRHATSRGHARQATISAVSGREGVHRVRVG